MYGSVRTVVWQGSAGDRRPYADQTRLCPLTGDPTTGKLPTNGVVGKMGFPSAYKAKAPSPNYRFVIALHSPEGVAETGLCVWPPEKNARKLARWVRRDTFSGAV